MSEDSNSKPYHLFSSLDPVIGHNSMATLHLIGAFGKAAKLGLASEGSESSSQVTSASPHSGGKIVHSLHEDVEMKSSGSGTESQGNESHGNESQGNESNGNESSGSSNSNSKDSALLESSGSNKSSNSQSLSPPSSSNAYSLLSASSEQDNPSTSGCSSEESAKAKTQKELIKTLKELKLHLPADKRNKGSKSTTLNTLKYALRCVKQVKANEEYYQMLMINDSQPSGLDVSSYTIEEINSITSEYTLKNPDMFAVAVSLVTGKIVYISDQAASILNCKQEVFKNSKFVEFLTPQDVSVFYSFTTPYRLPSWSMCTGAEASTSECIQEKSFFCRISGGRECKGNLQYYPFRMTPYLMKVQDTEHTEDQLCCLLLAERVHSGYDAPRIPTDKRVFTTTHTPNCVFQEVDERAVPLLGYLPQDLIGTPVLLHLHPNDRPIMLGIHRKILQYGGQPFDHSSIRFCARNGEYITMDTSWSSFVNPWSRKVSFVIARHKVRMGPVNEDVFTAPPTAEVKAMDSDIQEITEQIHRLLLQPVHNNSSSGYGSIGSNDHLVSGPSSSESTGNGTRSRPEEQESQTKVKTFHEICKGVHMQKNQGHKCRKGPGTQLPQLLSVQSPEVRPKDSAYPLNPPETVEDQQARVQEELAFKDQTVYSYQQISCLDSVIRYLESCNMPLTVKRKCQSSSNTTSSNSDEDKQKAVGNSVQVAKGSGHLKSQAVSPSEKPSGSGVASTSLTPLALPSKAESVMSITSQCSYSSTIVHVGDKKPQPESEITEDGPGPGDTTEGPVPSLPPTPLSPPSQEREAYKKLDLTKQVLAAHTQKEEQAFLYRFRELRGVHAFKPDSHYLERRKGQAVAHTGPARDGKPRGTEEACKGGRNKKSKSKRIKQNEPADVTESHRKQLFRLELQGLNQTSWSISDASMSGFPIQFPAVMPAYPLQVYPGTTVVPNHVETPLPGFGDSQCMQDMHFSTQPMHPQFSAPLITPVVALVLPNYVPTQLGSVPSQPFYPEQNLFQSPQVSGSPQTFPVQTQFSTQNPFLAPFPFAVPDKQRKPADPDMKEGPSRSSTPQSMSRQDRSSPTLFQSRCSSPLQLNLLQLEESQRSCERQDTTASSSGTNTGTAAEKGGNIGTHTGINKQQDSAGEAHRCDVLSSSSDILDILMQEDSHSATGSATSGSMGSVSNGCGTSASGSGECASRIGSTHTSQNSSNYFGSVDSSQESHKIKRPGRGVSGQMEMEQGESLIKCVKLQDPLWLLAANTDKTVMMTYQLPSRDMEQVLLEDRKKLKQMQKNQPQFSDKQVKELAKVHSWIREGGLPKAINIEACNGCKGSLVEKELSELYRGRAEVSDVTVHPSTQPQ